MGRYFVLEHKTCTEKIEPGEQYWQRLTLDTQASLYHHAALEKGYPISGVIQDVARKPGLRPKQKETPIEFGQRCMLDIAGHPDEYYRRGKVIRLDHERREALIDLAASTQAMRRAKREGYYPRNTDGCVRYHRLCEYFPVCTGATTIDDERYETSKEVKPRVSKSSLEAWRRCQREFYFSNELRRRIKRKTGALAQGTGFHEALEVWFKTLDLDAALAAVNLADEFETMRIRAMVVGYDARYRHEKWQVHAVEKWFEIPFADPRSGKKIRGIKLVGKFDAIIEEMTDEATGSSTDTDRAA